MNETATVEPWSLKNVTELSQFGLPIYGVRYTIQLSEARNGLEEQLLAWLNANGIDCQGELLPVDSEVVVWQFASDGPLGIIYRVFDDGLPICPHCPSCVKSHIRERELQVEPGPELMAIAVRQGVRDDVPG